MLYRTEAPFITGTLEWRTCSYLSKYAFATFVTLIEDSLGVLPYIARHGSLAAQAPLPNWEWLILPPS
jgi:hypothetical protein